MTGERAHLCEHRPRRGAEVLVEMDGRAGARGELGMRAAVETWRA